MPDEKTVRESSPKGQQGVEKDEYGRVTAVRLDRQILDPESPEAVQIPAETVVPRDTRYEDEVVSTETLDTNLKVGDKTAQVLDDTSRSHAPQTALTDQEREVADEAATERQAQEDNREVPAASRAALVERQETDAALAPAKSSSSKSSSKSE